VANGRLPARGTLEDIWIQPAAGDAAARSAPRFSSGINCSRKPRSVTGTDRQKGSLLGPAFTTREVCQFLDGAGAAYRQHSGHAANCSRRLSICWSPARLSGGSRPYGVSGRARLGRAQHPRRSAVPHHAGDHESQDSVQRKLPAVRPLRARRNTPATGSSSRPGTKSPYIAARRAGAGIASRARFPDDDASTMASDPDLRNRVERRAFGHSGGHARGLQRAHPDRGRRPAIRGWGVYSSRSTHARAAPCSSTRASTCGASRSSALPRTRIAASWPTGMVRWSWKDVIVLKGRRGGRIPGVERNVIWRSFN